MGNRVITNIVRRIEKIGTIHTTNTMGYAVARRLGASANEYKHNLSFLSAAAWRGQQE